MSMGGNIGDYAVAVLMGKKHSNPQQVISDLEGDVSNLSNRLGRIKNSLSSPSLNDTAKVVNFYEVRLLAMINGFTNNGKSKMTPEQRKEVHLTGLACTEYMKMVEMARRDIASLTATLQSYGEQVESGAPISEDNKAKAKLLRQYAKLAAGIISDNAKDPDASFKRFFDTRIEQLRPVVKYRAGTANIDGNSVPPFYPLDIAAINTKMWKDSNYYDPSVHHLSNVITENFGDFDVNTPCY